jgi:MFS transporter, SP family, general alpha glucoside:H+ symporter
VLSTATFERNTPSASNEMSQQAKMNNSDMTEPRATMEAGTVESNRHMPSSTSEQPHNLFHGNAAQEYTQINDAIAAGIARDVDDFMTLVAEADEANRNERSMKLLEAFRIYPKAMAWSVLLSSAIIMEGYDTAIGK